MHFSSLWLILLLWFCHFVLQSRFPISPFFTAPFFCHLYRPNLGFYASLFVRIPAFMRLCLSAFQLLRALVCIQFLFVFACPHPSFYVSLPARIPAFMRLCLSAFQLLRALVCIQFLFVFTCPHPSFYASLPARIPAFTRLCLSASQLLRIFTCPHPGFYASLPVYIPAFTHLHLSTFRLLHIFTCPHSSFYTPLPVCAPTCSLALLLPELTLPAPSHILNPCTTDRVLPPPGAGTLPVSIRSG